MAAVAVDDDERPSFPADRQDLNTAIVRFVDSARTLSMMARRPRLSGCFRTQSTHTRSAALRTHGLTPLAPCASPQAQTCAGWWATARVSMGYRLRGLMPHAGPVRGLAALGGGRVAVCSDDKTLCVWCAPPLLPFIPAPSPRHVVAAACSDAATGELIRTLAEECGTGAAGGALEEWALAVLPGVGSGRVLLASGSNRDRANRAVRLWCAPMRHRGRCCNFSSAQPRCC